MEENENPGKGLGAAPNLLRAPQPLQSNVRALTSLNTGAR